MMVILVEDLWWVGDMGRAGIREVVNMCSEAGSDSDAMLAWPRMMLDMDEHSAPHISPESLTSP